MNLLQPKISVIMPAYNVSERLEQAVKSVQNQSFQDIEIITVDCGSTDRTSDMLEKMANTDSRIRVLHKEGITSAEARNIGLQKAKGDYLIFVDADDWCEPGMLEDMITTAETHKLQIVVAGFFKDTYFAGGKRCISELCVSDPEIYTDKQTFREGAYKLFATSLFAGICNKLFLTSHLKNVALTFNNTSYDEKPYLNEIIRDAERVGVLDSAYYHFRKSRDFEDTQRWAPGMYERREREHADLKALYEYWNLIDSKNTLNMIQNKYFKNLVECIENVCTPKCVLSIDEKRRLIDKMISNPKAQKAASIACPKSRMLQLILGPIKKQNVNLVYSEGRFLSFIKRRNAKMFIDQQRAQ